FEQEDKPTLEFIEGGAAIPWEFLYEPGEEGPPDWKPFWGFRAPITHWQVNSDAAGLLQIRNGVFTTVCSTLRGSGLEIAALVEEVNRRVPSLKERHRSLEEALLERVEKQQGKPPDRQGNWLADHLGLCLDEYDREEWMRDSLVAILGRAR